MDMVLLYTDRSERPLLIGRDIRKVATLYLVKGKNERQEGERNSQEHVN